MGVMFSASSFSTGVAWAAMMPDRSRSASSRDPPGRKSSASFIAVSAAANARPWTFVFCSVSRPSATSRSAPMNSARPQNAPRAGQLEAVSVCRSACRATCSNCADRSRCGSENNLNGDSRRLESWAGSSATRFVGDGGSCRGDFCKVDSCCAGSCCGTSWCGRSCSTDSGTGESCSGEDDDENDGTAEGNDGSDGAGDDGRVAVSARGFFAGLFNVGIEGDCVGPASSGPGVLGDSETGCCVGNPVETTSFDALSSGNNRGAPLSVSKGDVPFFVPPKLGLSFLLTSLTSVLLKLAARESQATLGESADFDTPRPQRNFNDRQGEEAQRHCPKQSLYRADIAKCGNLLHP